MEEPDLYMKMYIDFKGKVDESMQALEQEMR